MPEGQHECQGAENEVYGIFISTTPTQQSIAGYNNEISFSQNQTKTNHPQVPSLFFFLSIVCCFVNK